MKTGHRLIMWGSGIAGMLSLLVLAGSRAPGASWESYWLVKGVALAVFGASFLGIKSVEDKIEEDE